MDIDKQVNILASQIVANIQDQVKTQVLEIVKKQINDQVAKVDFSALFGGAFASALKEKHFTFPDKSIPGSALDLTNAKMSGDNVSGGIIANFGSTGIDDKATACQVSIFDDVTVIENNLLTRDLTVKGVVTIDGALNVNGTVDPASPLYTNLVKSVTNNVRTSMDKTVFDSYSDSIFKKIVNEGLDLSKITIAGQEVIVGNTLSNIITESNLQKVGQLRELQVSGESLLTETLYTAKKRVGINTIEPTQALSIWDQEIEIGVGKKTSNTGIIGTPRSHTLIISSNGKDNLTLTPEGGVTVNQLKIGSINLSVSLTPPTNEQPKGSIVFNANPSLGGPMGWVCLGGANWANFGIID